MERAARHAWCERSQNPARRRRARNIVLATFKGAAAHDDQGLRSFHSLNPWLLSVHAPGVRIAVLCSEMMAEPILERGF